MKKILICGLSNSWGGAENIVLSIAARLAERATFDVVIPLGECDYEKRLESSSIHFRHIHYWGSQRKKYIDDLVSILTSSDYDYIWYNTSLMANSTIIKLGKKYSNAKIITHAHGSNIEESNILKRFVLRGLHFCNRKIFSNSIDYPLSCSNKASFFFYEGKNRNRATIINSGIDTEKFKFNYAVREEIRQELNVGDSVCLFHTGRLSHVKNQKKLISVTSELVKRGCDVKLYIAGDGELKEELESYISALYADQYVTLLGHRNDLNKLYQAMDVFLLPSFHEGFPLSLVEAQTSGLKCVVSQGVPQETNLSGHVVYLDINSSDEVWANKIMNIRDFSERENAYKIVRSKGYDINDVANYFAKTVALDL